MISIITPVFNAQDYIFETYKSILLQDFEDWEWVITDDCSTDQSCEIIEGLITKDSRVKLLKNETNSGAAVSRNLSISNAKGDYLAFLDIDDVWLDNKLSHQLNYMRSNNIDFSFTAYELIDMFGCPVNQTVDTKQRMPLSYHDMLRKKATLGCSTVMLRRDAFKDITMPLIRTGQDYALWLKLLKTNVKAFPIPIVFTQYRILPNSISRNKLKKARRQWQIYRELEKLPLIESMEVFCYYAFRAIFRLE